MESEDKKPIFTKRLILTILIIILIILIILLLLRRCGNGGGDTDNIITIDISPTSLTLERGESRMIYATTTSTEPIYWTSSDETCVTVSPAEGTQPIVTAGNKDCTAIITARAGTITSEITVTVTKTPDELTGLQLNKSNYIVYIGKSVLASVTAVPTTAQLPELIYRIEDTSIATVNENGVIKGVSEGKTVLIVTTVDGTASVTATVTVKKKASSGDDDQESSVPTYVAASGLEFSSYNEKEVCVGSQIILGYIIKPDNATNKEVRWSVNNPTDKDGLVNEYSSVDANGYVTGIKAGTTKITIISKDNPKLTATATITVLASSSSKCKSGGGSSSSGTPDKTPTGTDGTVTTTGTSGGMSCTVSGVKGSNGWYKSLTVTWRYTPSPGLWEDGTHKREYGIDGIYKSMPSNEYVHVQGSTRRIPSFSYRYYTVNATGYTTITKDKKGGCKAEYKSVDTENPTCKIDSSIENGKVKLSVTGSDENEHGSGVAKIVINNIGTSPKYDGERSATYTINVTPTPNGTNYSAIVYDVAGRTGTCAATLNSDGSLSKFEYVTEVVLKAYSDTIYRGGTGRVESYLRVAKYNSETNVTKITAVPTKPNVSGGKVSCSSVYCTVTPDEGSDYVDLSLSGFDKDGKQITKTHRFNVVDSKISDPTYDITCTQGNNGWCKSKAVVTLNGPTVASDDKIESREICIAAKCSSNGKIEYSENGTRTISYSLKTKKMGQYVTKKQIGTLKIDTDAPSCGSSRIEQDGKYSYTLELRDATSGIESYTLNDSTKKFYGVATYKNVSVTGKDGDVVTVYDYAGHSGSCKLSGTLFKLKSINVGGGDARIYKGGPSKYFNVSYTNSDNKEVDDENLRGFTVSGGKSTCFSHTETKDSITITAVSSSPCSGSLTLTSTYDSSVKANIDVYVDDAYKPTMYLKATGSTNINAGESVGLEASATTIKTADGKDWAPSVYIWSSNDTKCVTVNEKGASNTATAKEVEDDCSATITASAVYGSIYKAGAGVSATITINVKGKKTLAAPSISFTCAGKAYTSGTECTGDNVTANASVPSGGTARFCTGTGCNPSRTSLTILLAGTYNVCAKYIKDGNESATGCQSVTVKFGNRTLTISGNNTIDANGKTTLRVSGGPTGAIANYSWKSSATSCATVDNAGTVTGQNTKTTACPATITVYGYDMNGAKVAEGSFDITVKAATTSSDITIDCGTPSVTQYNKGSIPIVVKGPEGTSVSFSPSGVADVGCGNAGTISSTKTFQRGCSASKNGSYSITVNAGGKSQTCQGTVSGIITVSGNTDVESGKTTKLTASGRTGTQNWKSNNTNCATVDGSGTVTGVSTITKDCSTYITVTIGDVSVNTKVNVTASSGDDYACGEVLSRSNPNAKWTNQNVTIKIACTGNDCAKSAYEGNWTTTTNSGVIYIYNKTGAPKSCKVTVHLDKSVPTCKYTSTPATKWTKAHTVSVKCSDTGGSGCTEAGGTRSYNWTSSKEAVNFLVNDEAGNTTECGSYKVLVDATKPTYDCSLTYNSSISGVSGSCTVTDALSGVDYERSQRSFGPLKSTTTVCGYDKAGNSSCKTIEVTKAEEKYCPIGTNIYTATECISSTGTEPSKCPDEYDLSGGTCKKVDSHSGQYISCNSGVTPVVGSCNSQGCRWTCTYTKSPTCASGSLINGKCYTKVTKSSRTVYSATIK